jgi:hypothetical protein
MKKFFYSHPDTVIASLAVVFIVMLIWLYSWASNDIFTEIHQALTYSPSSPSDSFDLTDAAKLDLRGLLNNSSSTSGSAPVLPPATSSAFASTTAE